MNTTLLLTGLLLLAPAAYTADLAADAVSPECMGTPCDEINHVCGKLGGGQCLGRAATDEPECMGFPCDEVNRVCETGTGRLCVRGTAEAAHVEAPVDCASSVCSEVNERVCQPLFGIDCLYLAGDEEAVAATEGSCTGNVVCDTVNRVCGDCLPRAAE